MSALHFDGGTLELKLPFLPDLQLRWQDLLDPDFRCVIFDILVVSEERKEISLSYKGQLLRGANENVREALIQVLEGKVPETLQEKTEVEKEEVDEKEEPSSQSGNDASGPQTQSPVT